MNVGRIVKENAETAQKHGDKMNENIKNDILYITIGILLLITANYLMTGVHELTHQRIFSYAGIDSNIDFNLLGATTTPEKDSNKTMPEWALIGQVNTEAFGYQFQTGMICLIGTIIFSTMYLGSKF